MKHRIDQNKIHRKQRRDLSYEQLEARALLSADLVSVNPPTLDNSSNAPLNISWFESFNDVDRLPLDSLANVDRTLPDGVSGPTEPAVGEWIVQLADSAVTSLNSLSQANSILNEGYGDFTIIRGLGIPGSLLVRGQGASTEFIESRLSENKNVTSFSLNSIVRSTAVPNETSFGRFSEMTNLNNTGQSGNTIDADIDAPEAWDLTKGSTSIVVGVIDSGIDVTHPDLFLNVWLNQGEIPATFRNVTGKPVDIDGDGLVTLYDLNNLRATATGFVVASSGVAATSVQLTTQTPYSTGVNALFVRDLNGNGRIDAVDIIKDATWAQGIDNDNNGFVDDFFGWNFRAGENEPFQTNEPLDVNGHGTHVAGTIGAVGNNSNGVVGVNWRTSLMALKFLDENNQGDTASAIAAINYATMMRAQRKADVRVLNNSWGQPSNADPALNGAIGSANEAGILFVAAAGNGNILGQSVDNDRTPYYPASFEQPNVISVTASDSQDHLAPSYNFGRVSVDLAAPGVGILSTYPNGEYGFRSGTSMAAPHVAGAAALIFAQYPDATVAEVKQAILTSVDKIVPPEEGNSKLSTGGRLNAVRALNADVFAPAARLSSIVNIVPNTTSTNFTVEYTYRDGISLDSIGDDDVIVTRQWGPSQSFSTSLVSKSTVNGKTAVATYRLNAPGGTWDPLDFGSYLISTVSDKVAASSGTKKTAAREIGRFQVRIADPSVIYVDKFTDSLAPGTLRAAIIAANAAAPSPRTIILDQGSYTIDISPVVDLASTFPDPVPSDLVTPPNYVRAWSNATTGDLDIVGRITIVGDLNDNTTIDGKGLDRVFRVHPQASLNLSRITVHGGRSSAIQGGGGILSMGTLSLDNVIVKNNTARGVNALNPIGGGGVAVWAGNVAINESWITENDGDHGGGLFLGGNATGSIQRSTFDNNQGGGVLSYSKSNLSADNSTFSSNVGGLGALTSGYHGLDNDASSPSFSGDGRFVAFASTSSGYTVDTNNVSDIFVYDRILGTYERVSVSDTGMEGNGPSTKPSISRDGRFVAFASVSSSLVPGGGSLFYSNVFIYDRSTKTTRFIDSFDGNSPSISADGRFVAFESQRQLLPSNSASRNIFVFDTQFGTIEQVSVDRFETGPDGDSYAPTISDDGNLVAFHSNATDLVVDSNSVEDVFVFNRTTRKTQRVSEGPSGLEANGASTFASISGNGRFVAFSSNASNLQVASPNTFRNIFVVDLQTNLVDRVSVNDSNVAANESSFGASISSDGRFVSYTSYATNLAPTSTFNEIGVFVFDRTLRRNTRAARIDLVPGEIMTSISDDGGFVGFSTRTSLVAGDTDALEDVYVYNRVTPSLTFANMPAFGTINASFSTFAYTFSARTTVSKNSTVTNSLFIANAVVDETMPPEWGIRLNDTDTPFLSPLTQQGTFPPVHFLLLGNLAIDAAVATGILPLDQLKQTRVIPDLGAVEAKTANVRGKAFVDLNRNGILDSDEEGIPDVVILAKDQTIVKNPVEVARTTTVADDKGTRVLNEVGEFEFQDLSPSPYSFEAIAGSGWTLTKQPFRLVRDPARSNDEDSDLSSFSSDSRFVAFASKATTLDPNDSNVNNIVQDIFVYDTRTQKSERVSVGVGNTNPDLASSEPAISSDGRFIAFSSLATNLTNETDGNGTQDIFLYDRLLKITKRISKRDDGTEGNAVSRTPSISSDGRFVTFSSQATNLADGDINANGEDIFLYDNLLSTVRRISNASNGQSGDFSSFSPSISGNGNFITYTSAAHNLVPPDTNNVFDVFVYDRVADRTKRISENQDGFEGNDSSISSSISDDGRLVAFVSIASNLAGVDTNSASDIFLYDEDAVPKLSRVTTIPDGSPRNSFNGLFSLSKDSRFVAFSTQINLTANDVNENVSDVFVFDRLTKVTALVSINDEGGQGNNLSGSPSLSGDGRFISFSSDASNFTPRDGNPKRDIFIASNPLITPSVNTTLRAGEVFSEVNIGLVPDRGVISGTVFEDALQNEIFDVGENGLSGWTLFLDINNNRKRDLGEPSTTTNSQGQYRFSSVESYRNYSIAIEQRIGFEQVSPSSTTGFAWEIFLPAGGTVSDRDFALQKGRATGQSQSSVIDGIAFRDNIRNGVYDAATDTLLPNTTVFLDQAPFDGVWKNPERRTTTDANGRYTFSGLGAQIVNVVAEIGATATLISPKGSVFEKASEKLFPTKAVSTQQIQAMVSANFDGDAFPDLAVTVSDGDKISIRLNDGNGGFASRQIDIPLPSTGRGRGPIALQAGRFNNNSLTDLAVVNYFDSTIVIMLDFNGNDFASKTSIPVGTGPIDIAAGNFNNDAFIDLAVANSLSNTVSILLNNGSGGFTVSSTIPSGGLQPISIAVGHFNDDNADGFNRDGDRLDIAVANKNGQLATPGGGVSIFRGDGIGGFTLSSKLDAGPNPVDMVVADFDLDAKNTPDIAVNNQGALDVLTRTFSADQINVFPGSVNGTFGSFSAAVGTTGGTIDLIAVDVESDGDIDLVSSNSINGDVSIFRNTKKQSLIGAPLRFEPSEVIGLARLPLAQRNPIAAIDVDNSGTTDIVVIALIDVPNSTGTTTIKTPGINVLKNRATSGVHRVSLDGTNSVPNLNFATFSTAPRPFFNSLSDPNPIPEDAGTQTITITGVTGATGLQFSAVSSNPSIIPNPSVTYTGGTNPATMQYAAAANAFGTAIITVRATNPGSGTTVDAGVFERSFTITVSPVNDKPTVAFPIGKTVTVNEDAGSQIVAGFVNGITVGGGALEATQILQPLAMSASNPSLFQVQPAIDATGRLTFTGAANANGTSIVTLTIKDNGGNIDGGSDTHVEQFTIVLNAVNDAPAISIGGNQSALINSGAKTVTGFATGFLPGGGTDEVTQTVIGYQVTNDNPTIFASQPAIDLNGVLRYTPSATITGTANVSVRVRDNGGTIGGGIDLSATRSFSITIQSSTPVIDTIDLATLASQGMTIFGAEANDQSGYSVSSAGDVNGDGFDDLIIGARYGDALNNTKANAGETYIIFGRATPPATIDLANLGAAGVTIFGTDTADQNGRSVSSAGDVNGDGFDDLIVGSLSASATGNLKLSAGESYVIFGKAVLPSTIDLATLGTAGVTILGVDPSDTSGRSLSSAGDVNGDGFDDLIIGADLADASANAKADAGESYLIFGAATLPTTLDLALLSATAGVRIFGADAGDRSGLSVSSAGDINADGFDDLIVGAFGADASANAKSAAGDSYVIYGSASLPSAIDLAVLGTAGVTIFGAEANDNSGRSVSGAGDVNGDGFDDILIGAFGGDASANAKSAAGDSYVLFGGATLPSTLDVANLGTAGIRIFGAEANDLSGISVSNAGDINADGFDDLLLGAQGASSLNNTRISAGESYVIFGRSFLPSTIDIANFASVGGLMLLGIDRADSSGNSVSNAGDVNGDGFDDLIVGAFIADSVGNARLNAGESYVIFGGNGFTASITHPGTPIAETLTGTVNPDVMVGGNGNDIVIGNGGVDVISGGQGNDILAVSDLNFKRIVGGTGNDTLRLDGGNLLLNLTTLRDNRLLDIETIDLTGSGNNSLILKQRDVLNLSSSSNTLTVRGNTGDRLEMEPGWVRTASQVVGVDTFLVFTRGAAILRVTLPVVVQITMDLASLGAAGTTIFGAEANDQSGFSVSNAGDVNGDGFEDMIIGARYGDGFGNTKANAGESYLVYGSPSLPSTIDLLNLGSAGITFIGAEAGDNSGHSVSSAGDINGDGFSDLLVGAISGDAIGNTKASAGDSYVIFGGATLPALINIASLATPSGVPGVILVGGDANDTSGRSVSSAGDVNADGFDDLIIGANGADASGNLKADAGESYIVFGAATLPTVINFASLGTAGVTIFGADAGDQSGFSVNNAGDVNGDGFDDLIIGAFAADASGNAKLASGDSYVVFGGPALPSTINLASLGTAGFTIFGAEANDSSGRSVSSAGDVNGDGFDDILVGAHAADALNNTKLSAGDSYLIYGRAIPPASIDLSALGTAGITIYGVDTNDGSGISVSSAGDVNGDGLDDLIIGAWAADALGNAQPDAGDSYVIFGSATLPTTIDLATFGTVGGASGFSIYGAGRSDLSGNSVSSAGDVNGDGFDDLIIGAFLGDGLNNLKTDSGESYVLFGSNSFTSSVTHLGTSNSETITGTAGNNVMNGGRGNDTLIGSGGADFLNGGQGNDVLAVSDMNFKRINGGTGSDTLRLDGSGLTLNLTSLRDNRLLGIETIDITGSGNNTLVLDKREVLNLSDESNTLIVRRNTGDVVTMGSGWVQGANQTINSVVFNVFTQGAATLKIAADTPPLAPQARLAAIESEAPNIEPVTDEVIYIMPSPRQNATNRFDVNKDGSISPVDVLVVINALRRYGSASDVLTMIELPEGDFDVDGDFSVSPIDVLQVINRMNRRVLSIENTPAPPSSADENSNIASPPSSLPSNAPALGEIDMSLFESQTAEPQTEESTADTSAFAVTTQEPDNALSSATSSEFDAEQLLLTEELINSILDPMSSLSASPDVNLAESVDAYFAVN